MVIGAGQRRTDRRHPPTLGLRTLLAERHHVSGGCATSFRRGRFEFETALHQLSRVGLEVQPYMLRGLFESIFGSARTARDGVRLRMPSHHRAEESPRSFRRAR